MGVIRKTAISKANRSWSEEDRLRLNARITATQVEHVPIVSLKPNPKNAKQHPQKQIELLAANIRKFGLTQPMVVDEDDILLCGHARLQACKLVGVETVTVIRLTHLSDYEKKALAIADNRLPELGEWDNEILREDLRELTDPTIELGFDFEITGYDSVDVDTLVGAEAKKQKDDPADQVPGLERQVLAITKPGDLWLLGQHVLLCGDARSGEAYQKVLNGDHARLVFTDPPYNVRIGGNVSKRSDVPEFEMASGEMTEEEFTNFLRTSLGHIADHAERGAVVYVCMDHAHLPDLLAAAKPIFGRHKNLAVWVKSNAGLGSFYRSQHELVAIFIRDGAPPINNFGLGARGRFRTNVWNYPGLNAFSADRAALLAMHPTIKPVAMVADAIRDCSNRNDVILDPFGGSGTTLIACQKVGRKARVIELDPYYCDVIVRRFEKFAGEPGKLAGTGETFAEIVAGREGQERGGSEMDRDAEIGYGKPPVHSRFKKGQSGNAKGRPKKPTKLGHPHQVLIELLGQPVSLKVGNKTVKMTKYEALLTRLFSAAMSGDNSSLDLLMKKADKLPQHLLEDVGSWRANSQIRKAHRDVPDQSGRIPEGHLHADR